MQKFGPALFSFFWLTCLAVTYSQAQVFPIQSSVSLMPPYSGNLSDYTFPGAQRIRISLTCNDISISNYRVKLRITIEGLGITLRSKPNFSYEPLIIDGGSPLLLYGDDLIQYLDPRNLDFSGLSKAEYQRTGKLPEGVYRFHVEVLDYNRGTVVSNKGFATAWVVLNDVPILNLPATNSKTRLVDPTNIPFTWTPRHTGSPNSAFTTEYVFRLIEIWPSNRNPNDAFLTQMPLYEIETSRSQIVYGPGEPALIPGRKYAWQVQARDTEGRDLFRNNGKSEVFVFQFGDAIEMPQNVRKETANATTISVRWEASSTGEIPERFRIRFRPEGGTTWYEETTTQYWHTLTGLQSNKAYDIQVRSEAGRQVSDYTFNQRHSTTLPVVDENFQCGNPFNIQAPAMTTPLQTLQRGDMIKCADFNVRVEEITASTSPNFSGKGFAKIYMFAGAWVEVTFSGTFNAEYEMTSGSIKTTYQKGSKFAQITEEMKKIGENKPNLDSAKAAAESGFITITGIVDSVYMNEDGEIVVVSEDGTEQTFQQQKNANGEKQETIVKDSAGNTWTVDKDGNITKAEAALAGVYATRDSLNFVVIFKENETDQYGFDGDNNFPTPSSTQVNNIDYFVGWKSVEQGKQDFVDATVQSVSTFPKKVGFKIDSQNASAQPGTHPANSKVIFPGAFDGESHDLTAYAKVKASGNEGESEVVLGKLKVVTYEFIRKKVVIVPVNEPTQLTGPEIQAKLNKIYGQAVAGWQVTIDNLFEIDESFIQNLDQEESGNLASYNKKMRDFNRAYKNSTATYDRDAFYIFLIKGTDFRFDAFMPFKRGFGYVFVDKVSDPIRTIAHELGHGAFNLRHTFDQFSVSQKSTNNLMDYNGGEVLKKYQWDYVHDPESMIGWLQEDEEGAYESTGIIEVQSSSNLQLDPDNIKVNFKLKDWQKKIDESSFPKKGISDYSMLLFVVRNDEIVYSFSKELSQTGNIEWHGLVSVDEEAMTLDNYKEFSLHIGIIPKEYTTNEPFLNYQAFLGSRPESTVLKYGNDKASEVKFVDVIQSIPFKLNFAALEWKKFTKTDNILMGTEGAYQASRESYIERLKEIGVDTDKVSPIDYLNEHLVPGDFLGMPIYGINIRYLYVLRKIEEQMGRKQIWNQSTAPFTSYVNELRADGMYLQDIARMSNVKESLSDHATGFALDFRKEDNIWIRYGHNNAIATYIEVATGGKMLERSYSAEESKTYHEEFLSKIRSNDVTKSAVEGLLKKLDGLEIDIKSKIDTITLQTERYLADIREQFERLSLDSGETKNWELQEGIIAKFESLKQLANDIGDFAELADQVLFMNFEPYLVSENFHEGLGKYKILTDGVLNLLRDSNRKDLLYQPSRLANLTEADYEHIKTYFSKYKDRRNLVKGTLTVFAAKLNSELNSPSLYYGPKVLEVGFFSLPTDIVNSIFNKTVKVGTQSVQVKWGGHYGNSKDFMHFEIKPSPGDRSHQQILHSIPIAEIKAFLNSFKQENSASYGY